jgi:hypothetical protein
MPRHLATTPAPLGGPGPAGPRLQLSRYFPLWLTGRRGLIVAAVAAGAVGLTLGWPWLVAAGVAPILLSTLPCAAMCALGLCMMGRAGQSCSTQQGPKAEANNAVPAASPITAAPVSPVRQIAARESAEVF